MPSIRGAYPLDSITKLEKENCDEYQLILIQLNKMLKYWKVEKELFDKSFSLFTKSPNKSVYDYLPLFIEARKKDFERKGKNPPEKINKYEFYEIWEFETEKIANDIYIINLLRGYHSNCITKEESNKLLELSFNTEQPEWLIKDFEDVKLEIKIQLEKLKKKEELINAKNRLKTMEDDLSAIIEIFQNCGLDTLKCEEVKSKLNIINSTFKQEEDKKVK